MLTTLPPLLGVRETLLMATAKERIEVVDGGTNGIAASVTLREALPPTLQFVVH